MDIFIDGPAGKIDLRHKGLDAKPKQTIVLTQGANLSGQLGYDLSFDGRTDYSMMDALVAQGFGVVTFAVRGYRKSELNHDPLEVGTEQAIEDLAAVMDWVRDQGYATPDLLGWSWGGRIVGHYASRFPDRLGRLILMDPSSKMPHGG
jgi:pimeloyl-ACP methyl ester carboxylesterase